MQLCKSAASNNFILLTIYFYKIKKANDGGFVKYFQNHFMVGSGKYLAQVP